MTRISLVAVAMTLSSCGESGAIKSAVTESLFDPDSVKFGEMLVSKSREHACINVNAKNRLGGYTGEQGFYLAKIDVKWTPYSSGDLDCNKSNLEHMAKA